MTAGTIYFELAVPSVWPPESEVVVYQGILDRAKLRVTIHPDATMQFLCVKSEEVFELVTPRLDMPDYANLKVAFAWGGEDEPSAAINGVLLCGERTSSGEIIKISSRDRVATGLREKLVVQLPVGLTLQEERLIRSLLELQERIIHADRVHLLEASAILRQILLDAHPLAHMVNRIYRCKLQFPVVPERVKNNAPEGPTFAYINLSPLYASQDEVRLVSWDQFLALEAVRGEDIAFSVQEVLDVCANIKGGVHFGDAKSEVADRLLDLDQNFQPALVDASLHALADLSWCVLQGLKPLVAEILSKHNGRTPD